MKTEARLPTTVVCAGVGVKWANIESESYLTAPRVGSSVPSKSGYVYTFTAWGPCSHTCEIIMGKQVDGIQVRSIIIDVYSSRCAYTLNIWEERFFNAEIFIG